MLSTFQSHPPSEPPVVPGSIAPSPARFLEAVPGADYWHVMTPNERTKEMSFIKSLREAMVTQDTSGRLVSFNPGKAGAVLSISR